MIYVILYLCLDHVGAPVNIRGDISKHDFNVVLLKQVTNIRENSWFVFWATNIEESFIPTDIQHDVTWGPNIESIGRVITRVRQVCDGRRYLIGQESFTRVTICWGGTYGKDLGMVWDWCEQSCRRSSCVWSRRILKFLELFHLELLQSLFKGFDGAHCFVYNCWFVSLWIIG